MLFSYCRGVFYKFFSPYGRPDGTKKKKITTAGQTSVTRDQCTITQMLSYSYDRESIFFDGDNTTSRFVRIHAINAIGIRILQ